jgi:hypothetical protein
MLTGGRMDTKTDAHIDEYWHDVKKLWDETPDKMMNLPIKETPEIPWDDPGDWCDVAEKYGVDKHGHVLGTNIQKAIDEGYTTIFLSTGYKLQQTIKIRNKVRRIIGTGSDIKPWGCDFCDSANVIGKPKIPMWQVVDGEAEAFEFQHFAGTVGGYKHLPFIDVATTRTVVIKHMNTMMVMNSVEGGDIFVEDHGFPTARWKGKNVWARSINPEHMGNTPGTADVDGYQGKVYNRGGVFWLLGGKQEGNGSWVRTYDGGFSEILGCLIRTIPHTQPVDTPVLYIDNSNVSTSGFIQFNTDTEKSFAKIVIEKRGNDTRVWEGNYKLPFPENFVAYDATAVENKRKEILSGVDVHADHKAIDMRHIKASSAKAGQSSFILYDLQGRRVFSGSRAHRSALSAAPLANGIVLVKQNGMSKAISRKVVVNK